MFPTNLLDVLNKWVNDKFIIPCEVGFRHSPSPIVQGEFVITAKRRLTAPFSGLPEVIVKEHFQTAMVAAGEFSKNDKADEIRLSAFLTFIDNKFISKVTEAETKMFDDMNLDGWQ